MPLVDYVPKCTFVTAERILDQVTGITAASAIYGRNSEIAQYTYHWQPTDIGTAAKLNFGGPARDEMLLQKYDDGWKACPVSGYPD